VLYLHDFTTESLFKIRIIGELKLAKEIQIFRYFYRRYNTLLAFTDKQTLLRQKQL
jgi:hypothetical protein